VSSGWLNGLIADVSVELGVPYQRFPQGKQQVGYF
jgi:hypothetical protein